MKHIQMALLFAVTALATPEIDNQIPTPDAIEKQPAEEFDEATISHTGFVNDADNDENEESENKNKQVQAEEPDYDSKMDIKFVAAPALGGLLILSTMLFDWEEAMARLSHPLQFRFSKFHPTSAMPTYLNSRCLQTCT